MEAVGGPSTWRLGGAYNCGKAQPGQVAAVSHGCPSALFRGVNVLNTRIEARPMISAQQVVDIALEAAARRGRADETIVLVTDRLEASLRWANNSMTTNGVSTARSNHRDFHCASGQYRASRFADVVRGGPAVIEGLVAASQAAASSALVARDAAPLLSGNSVPGRLGCADAGHWPRGVRRRRSGAGSRDSAAATSCTASRSTRWRRRIWRHRPGCAAATRCPPVRWRSTPNATAASAWVAVGTPDFADVPTESMLEQLATRLGWAKRSVELPAGRYETILPPSAVADMMVYLAWSMAGRGAQEGRTRIVFARRRNPGGGAADRAAADAVFGSDRARVCGARRSWRPPVRRRRCRFSTTAWPSTGWTGSATG